MNRQHAPKLFSDSSIMSFARTSVTESWTVRDVSRCFPMSILVFHKLGIDTYRDASATLDTAAGTAGVGIGDLMAALGPCVEQDDPWPSVGADMHTASD